MRGTLLTTLHTLGKEWRVTLDFKPTGYLSGWTSSIHLTIEGNNRHYGYRTPYIHPKNPNTGKMRILSAVNGIYNYAQEFDQLPVDAWTTITISQTLEGGKYMYRITIGGQELHAVENTQAVQFHNVKVYGSDPWYDAQPGSIRNLVIETRL